MSKLLETPRLPEAGEDVWRQRLIFQATELLRQVAIQVNGLSEGRIQARYNAQTSAPTTGSYEQGDFIANSAPTEDGTAGAKFVVTGWQCVAAGTPGTWVACRFLTGA